MKATTISRAWKQLCLLFAFLSYWSYGQDTSSCSSSEFSFEQLNQKLKEIKNCLEAVSGQWTPYQNAEILNQLIMLSDIIQKQQSAELLRLLPENCTAPAVPKDGGLLCVSAENKIYCKPMCNAGYDFNFIRRSRLYEECSAATQHKWTTQFIGGNRLADCSKSHISVAGAPSAYFHEGKDCHKTNSDEQLVGNITNIFQSELVKAGITKLIKSSGLLCG
ncbi:uncharacterized protein si:ch1073-126c3.2 [Myxocyprinus asiaticus]|uniref:uncharacterized protein si:ch1073-126c3.2 n=1 Tax=Myxocyprinus asiaticus TaxID=70543 RepID=UPI0022235A2F|nr:uncharacterized protein si:ch1073-126c3.2 [Myxocyprinus asiaticus]